MIAPQRNELIKAIEELSLAYPEMRLGQLVANLAALGRGIQVGDIWEAEDAELLEGAKQLLASAKQSAAAPTV